MMRAFIRYFLVALTGVAIDWVLFAMLIAAGLPPAMAQGISRGIAAVYAFWGMRRSVFGLENAGTAELKQQMLRFALAVAVMWMVSLGLVWVLSQILPIWLSKIGTDGVTFLLNWFVMKIYVFRQIRMDEPR